MMICEELALDIVGWPHLPELGWIQYENPSKDFNENIYDNLISERKIKYARFHCLATLVALKSISKLERSSFPSPDRLGIITTGGPYNVRNAWNSTQRILDKGHRFITPAEFPHTIISSFPTTLAAEVGACAFAFAMGDNETSLLEALYRAAQLVLNDQASTVLVATVFAPDSILLKRFEGAQFTTSTKPLANCVVISRKSNSNTMYRLHKIAKGTNGIEKLFDKMMVDSNSVDHLVQANVRSDKTIDVSTQPHVRIPGLLSSSGVIPFWEAARLSKKYKSEKILFGIEDNQRTAGAVIERKG